MRRGERGEDALHVGVDRTSIRRRARDHEQFVAGIAIRRAVERQVEVGVVQLSAVQVDEIEARRRDPDDGPRDVLDHHRAPDDRRIGAEARAPERIGKNDGGVPFALVARVEQAAGLRTRLVEREEVRAYRRAAQHARRPAASDQRPADRDDRRNGLQRAVRAALWEVDRVHGYTSEAFSVADFDALRGANRTLKTVAAIIPLSGTLVGRGGPPRVLRGTAVSADFFTLYQARPEAGRLLDARDEREGNTTVVLSDALWRARFGADPAIVGRTVMIEDIARTVVGIAPPRFYFIDLHRG